MYRQSFGALHCQYRSFINEEKLARKFLSFRSWFTHFFPAPRSKTNRLLIDHLCEGRRPDCGDQGTVARERDRGTRSIFPLNCFLIMMPISCLYIQPWYPLALYQFVVCMNVRKCITLVVPAYAGFILSSCLYLRVTCRFGRVHRHPCWWYYDATLHSRLISHAGTTFLHDLGHD